MEIKEILELILKRESMQGYIVNRKIQNQDTLAHCLFGLIAEVIKPNKAQVEKLTSLEGLIIASKMVNKSQFDQLLRKNDFANEGEKGKAKSASVNIEGLFEWNKKLEEYVEYVATW